MIPKKIHYCWVGGNPKPDSVIYCIESWKKYCPDYEIIEWNETNYDFSKNQYMKEAYEAKKWGFVPDYARLDIIYQHGGIYFDTDVELIRNIDDLLTLNSFFGFEDTGENEYYIACGLGFGSEKNNELLRRLRDYYDTVYFKLPNNIYNLLPSPRHNQLIFESFGVKMDNTLQCIEGNMFLPSDYFCPKVFSTGKIQMTNNTKSIHHFTASWMDEKIKSEIDHNQKIYNKFGNRMGGCILLLESVYKKYGFFGVGKQICIKLIDLLYDFRPLCAALFKKQLFRNKSGNKKNIIFDTSAGTMNLGDHIIMDNCKNILACLIDLENSQFISTHSVPEKKLYDEDDKILCGTNILSGKMRNYKLWKLPYDLEGYSNIRLLGVGFDSFNQTYDLYTKLLFKILFSNKGFHSVRDSFSEKMLKKIGIKNVLNTACPTMWGLTPDHCSKIPLRKGKNVVCTITDYLKDNVNDFLLIQMLISLYDKVYFWPQGTNDVSYLKELSLDEKVIVLEETIEDFDRILSEENMDYVGTRLHAGIRALSHGRRSIIISIDNRAKSIAMDTGLPIIDRRDIHKKLKEKIISDFPTKITLPMENIELWKAQFSTGNQEE